MIKTQHEYEVAASQAAKFRTALEDFGAEDHSHVDDRLVRAQKNSLQLLLADLESEMNEFESRDHRNLEGERIVPDPTTDSRGSELRGTVKALLDFLKHQATVSSASIVLLVSFFGHLDEGLQKPEWLFYGITLFLITLVFTIASHAWFLWIADNYPAITGVGRKTEPPLFFGLPKLIANFPKVWDTRDIQVTNVVQANVILWLSWLLYLAGLVCLLIFAHGNLLS